MQPLTTVKPAAVHVYESVPVPPVAATEYANVCPGSITTVAVRGELMDGGAFTVTVSHTEVADSVPPIACELSVTE